MVKQQRRTDRCFVAAAGNSVTLVRFPVGPAAHRRHRAPQQVDGSTTTEEERAGSAETKRARLHGTDDAAALTNPQTHPGSCDQPGSESSSTADQQGAAELSELQAVRSLKVTIQQSSESREFRQTDRQTGGLHCHVCDISCPSAQVFQDHMSGSEHLRKLKEMTHNIRLNTHTLQDRGRRPDSRRWCDACQTHFSGDVIVHRRTKQHKMCKQLCRPFCPVCKRHFRTPRKFVEHMKSAEHKEQVHRDDAQEEELITVDAVGCFQEEEEEEEEGDEEGDEEGGEGKEEKEEVEVTEEEEEEVEVAVEEEDGGEGKEVEEVTAVGADVEAADAQEADGEEYDPHTIYGSSFVLPVSGFLCRLCNKFFYRETTARHTHCRTHTHYLNLQSHRSQQKHEEDTSSL